MIVTRLTEGPLRRAVGVVLMAVSVEVAGVVLVALGCPPCSGLMCCNGRTDPERKGRAKRARLKPCSGQGAIR